jgi:hypothetical protein
MPVTGIDQVKGRLKLIMDQAKGAQTEAAVTEMLIIGGSMASELTPVDTNFLLNSQGRKTQPTPTGFEGAVYYGAKYAGWVHEMSGKLKGQPRAHFGVTSNHSKVGPQMPTEFGGGTKTGNYWDPDAEPHFLTKGMEKMAKEAPNILKKHYAVNE